MDFSVRDESEITDKGNLDKSKIMDMESTDNGADNDAGADNVVPDKSDVIDGANNSSLYTKLCSGL